MSKKKIFTFEYEITGKCFTEIEADTEEEAIAILRTAGGSMYEISEWDIDYPNGFSTLSTEEMMKDCANIEELE